MEQVIEMLLSLGFQADGQTPRKEVAGLVYSSTDRSGWAKKLSTTGGRQRFVKGNLKVTVGPRTTCVYSSGLLPHNPFKPITITSARNFKTKHDLSTIREYIEN